MANVSFILTNKILYAYLSGEIDHHTAQFLRRLIDEKIADQMPDELVMDFSNVGFMDSSGVGLILGRLKQMNAYEGKMRVQSPPVQIQKMLQLAQIEFG